MITLADTKEYLRIDHDDDDALITSLIASAMAFALAYCGDPEIVELDPVPADIQLALKRGVAILYDGAGAPVPPDVMEAMSPLLAAHRKWCF